MLTTEQLVQAHYARHLLNSVDVDIKPVVIKKLESLLTQNQVAIASIYAEDTSEKIAANCDDKTAAPSDNSGSFDAIYASTLYKALDDKSANEYISFLESNFSTETQYELKEKAKESSQDSLSLILERLKKAWS
jgi:hypothetical protein